MSYMGKNRVFGHLAALVKISPNFYFNRRIEAKSSLITRKVVRYRALQNTCNIDTLWMTAIY